MRGLSRRWRLAAVASAMAVFALSTSPAQAHGPVAPVASSYLARVAHLPVGVQAKVVDADQSMWLRAYGRRTVVVLDYRGAPYLRFSRTGVAVNERSEMYYLNANPVESVPANLTRTTPADWQPVSAASQYLWHDGRLHALATVALAPGTTDVGTWRIPLLVAGRPAAISGELYHAPDPPLVWFWPIVVILACVLAAWRVHRSEVDKRVGFALALAALAAVGILGVGRGLYGRPDESVGQLVELSLLLGLAAMMLWRLVTGRAGYFTLLVVAIVALYEDLVAFPVLLQGYVLMVVPAFLARAAVTTCIGAAIGLLPVSFRLGDREPDDPPQPEDGPWMDDDVDEAWA